MKELFVRYGQSVVAVAVSDIDLDRVRQHTWRADDTGASGKPYVKATVRTLEGRWTSLYMHRFITGCPAVYRVDHRDQDTLNNQRPNLRIATHDQNNLNRSPWGISGYKGVSLRRARFRARITIDHVEKHLGYYGSAVEAAMAYDAAAHKLFGEFAWLNFPEHYPAPCPDIEVHDIPFFGD